MKMTKMKDIRKWFVTAAVLFLSVMWGSFISPDEAVRNAANASAYTYLGKITDKWDTSTGASTLADTQTFRDWQEGEDIYIVSGSPDGGKLSNYRITIKNSSGATVDTQSASGSYSAIYTQYATGDLPTGKYTIEATGTKHEGTTFTFSDVFVIHPDLPATFSGNAGDRFSFDALDTAIPGQYSFITWCASDRILTRDEALENYNNDTDTVLEGSSISFTLSSELNGIYLYYIIQEPVDGDETSAFHYISTFMKIVVGGSGDGGSGNDGSGKAQSISVPSSMKKTLGSGSFNIVPTGNIFTYLSFKSSNTSVANVTSFGSYGRVDMKKPGLTKITISAPGTSEYKAASKTVTVKVVCSKPKVKVKVKNGRMTISWNKVKGAKKYKVSITQHGVKTTTLPLTSKRKISNVVKKGKKYTIKVKALDSTKKYGSAWAKKTVKS